jgi:hypothetical protein
MNLGLFIGCLAILLAAYWWVLNRLKPRVMRLGLIGAFGLWMGAWFVAALVAGLTTAFVDQANWAFLVGLILAGTMNTWIYVRLVWEIGRNRKAAEGRSDN